MPERTAPAGKPHDAAGALSPEPTEPALAHEPAKEPAADDAQGPWGLAGPKFSHSPFTVGFGFALGALLAYALFQGVAHVSGPLMLIVVAAILAVGLDPVVERLQKRGMQRGWAIAAVFVSFALMVVAFAAIIMPPLISQIITLAEDFPSLVADLRNNATIADLDTRFQLLDRLEAAASDGADNLVSGAFGAAQLLATTIFNLLTVTILTLYFLATFHPIKETFYRLTPASRRPRITTLTEAVLQRAGGYVTGQLAISALAGLAAYAYLRIAGVQFASALALLVAVFSIIPMVGATIGSVIVSIIAAIQSPALGLATLVFFIAYQQFENYVLHPRVMRRAVNVHPAAALVGALIGGSLLGIVGAIIAVPVVAGIQLIIEEVVIPRQETA